MTLAAFQLIAVISLIWSSTTGAVKASPESLAVEPLECQVAAFQDAQNWEAYDAGMTGGMFTRGYFGGAFDGRYIYYAPCRTADFHGRVLRYDTTADFRSPGGWEAYNASQTGGLATVGYAGAVYDGRYVYFVPFSDASTRHARVLRYDTTLGFSNSVSWAAYDAGSIIGLPYSGYCGAVFDGRFIYFAPFGYSPYAHGRVLRLDTEGQFTDSGSWTVYDAGSTDGLVTKGYYGAVADERYVYFVPFHDGVEFHGRVLRYDRTGDFAAATSWRAYDAGATGGLSTIGYKGACFDGRFVFFAPFREESACHGRIMRFDTAADFTTEASWTVYDASGTGGLDTRGYVGAEFDGRYVYFIPYECDELFHARALRYDSISSFSDSTSWISFDAGSIDGLTTKGYKFSVFDGRYLYLIPYHNNLAFSGIALRYDTAALQVEVPTVTTCGIVLLLCLMGFLFAQRKSRST